MRIIICPEKTVGSGTHQVNLVGPGKAVNHKHSFAIMLQSKIMNLKIKTKVAGNYQAVMARFDRALFEALAPRQGEMKIVEFTGSKKGDKVHIRFLKPLKAEWISVITEDATTETEAYFIDEGVQLPFPLSYWRHKHIVRKITEDTCCIIDDITFRGPNALVDLLLYPAIFLGFYPRKKIYRQYFGPAGG